MSSAATLRASAGSNQPAAARAVPSAPAAPLRLGPTSAPLAAAPKPQAQAPEPADTAALIRDYLNPNLTFADVADLHRLTLVQLAEFLQRQDVARAIEFITAAEARRARHLASACAAKCITTLESVLAAPNPETARRAAGALLRYPHQRTKEPQETPHTAANIADLTPDLAPTPDAAPGATPRAADPAPAPLPPSNNAAYAAARAVAGACSHCEQTEIRRSRSIGLVA